MSEEVIGLLVALGFALAVALLIAGAAALIDRAGFRRPRD